MARTNMNLPDKIDREMRHEAVDLGLRYPGEFVEFLWEQYKKYKMGITDIPNPRKPSPERGGRGKEVKSMKKNKEILVALCNQYVRENPYSCPGDALVIPIRDGRPARTDEIPDRIAVVPPYFMTVELDREYEYTEVPIAGTLEDFVTCWENPV